MIFKTGKIDIDKLLDKVKTLSTERKIVKISQHFLGIPYKKNSLIGSFIQQEQLVIDFEGVDCMTFIEYVEAMRMSDSYSSFVENLRYVRYFDGIVDFKKKKAFFYRLE